MAQVRVLQKSYIGNRIVEEGEVIEYDGELSDNLELVKKGKKAAEAPAADTSGTDQAGAGESLV
jgi:hypothetical protein